jgi:hypothetical protein
MHMVKEPSSRPVTLGYHADTHALVNRLRRIEGQVRTDAARVSPEEVTDKLGEATPAIARLVRS